jgi:hypothetical protein
MVLRRDANARDYAAQQQVGRARWEITQAIAKMGRLLRITDTLAQTSEPSADGMPAYASDLSAVTALPHAAGLSP